MKSMLTYILTKTEFTLPKDALRQIWLKLAKWLGEGENVKSLQTEGQMRDSRQSGKRIIVY